MSASVHPQVTQATLELAMRLLYEEREKMLAVSICLLNRLEPKNIDDIQDDEDATAWRLVQVLEERLSGLEFENAMRQLLHVQELGVSV